MADTTPTDKELERLTRELDAEIDAELDKPENVARRLARQARRLTDADLTRAIQAIGANRVHVVVAELFEGLRNGHPDGYPALRRLLAMLESNNGGNND